MGDANLQNKGVVSGLSRLRELCEELNDRDSQLKKDIQLFDGFFNNFPIPVTMWSIGKDHTILSKRGNAFTCHEASSLEEIFKCPMIREQSITKHESALQGNTVSYFVEDSGNVYWTRLVPRKNDKEEVIGVIGLAWDVTTNAIMLASLENILSIAEGSGSLDEIKAEAQRGFSCSRLRKMFDEETSDA